MDTQYDKAAGLAQPPFSDDEMRALQTIDKQPKARQCNSMLRLFEAIDRLDAHGKAIIFRGMMSQDSRLRRQDSVDDPLDLFPSSQSSGRPPGAGHSSRAREARPVEAAAEPRRLEGNVSRAAPP
jgi:hypothetical protein